MNHVTRAAISRRTFLRGVGAAIALPYLDAMTPAFAGAPERVRRAVFVFVPNGIHMQDWTPRRTGKGYDLPPTLEPLESIRGRVSVISGLDLDGARSHGDGPGDHARACSAFLTGAHPVKTKGADIEIGVSVDQVLAKHVGGATRFSSLELGLERGRRAGSCDSGYACAYTNNIAWRTATTPVAKETDPREVFRRLFGDPDDVEARAREERRRRRRRSLLDVTLEDARRLRAKLGRHDRAKVDEYLEAVREVEKRLQGSGPEGVVGVPESVSRGGDRMRAMYDVIGLALRTDSTRVVTFMLGNAGSNRSYPELDIADGHHDTSHHGEKEANYAKLRKIDRHNVAALSAFLGGLAAVDDGGSDLLSRTAVLYGSGISDGDRHDHGDLPILLGGECGGTLRSGKHVVARPGTPLANLHMRIAKAMGVPAASFGDSSGVLAV